MRSSSCTRSLTSAFDDSRTKEMNPCRGNVPQGEGHGNTLGGGDGTNKRSGEEEEEEGGSGALETLSLEAEEEEHQDKSDAHGFQEGSVGIPGTAHPVEPDPTTTTAAAAAAEERGNDRLVEGSKEEEEVERRGAPLLPPPPPPSVFLPVVVVVVAWREGETASALVSPHPASFSHQYGLPSGEVYEVSNGEHKEDEDEAVVEETIRFPESDNGPANIPCRPCNKLVSKASFFPNKRL